MTRLLEPFEVNRVAAPIAAIDRRQLSQAWRSALGLLQQKGRGGRTSRGAAIETSVTRKRTTIQRPRGSVHSVKIASLAISLRRDERAAALPCSAAASGVPRTRKKHGAPPVLVRATKQTQRTAITLRGPRGTVHVLIGGCETRPRIVAAYLGPLRIMIERAIAGARYAACR